jgi:SnoaL-like polyketide cyclase
VTISLADASCVLRRALLALAVGDVGALELFTEDVIGDSPVLCVRSRTELEFQLLDRVGALSNVEFDLDQVSMTGPDTAVVSWRVAGDHTGEVLFNEDIFFGPTGRQIRMSLTTLVRFSQRRIAEFGTSYDDTDLFDQLRGRPSEPDEWW